MELDYNIPDFVEDSYYIYYLDGRIYSKWKKSFLKFGKDGGGYLRFRDSNFPGGKMRSVHRVLYEKFNGVIPDDKVIDHVNNKRDDNRLCNLQLLSHQQNTQKQGIRINNTSGYKGVYFDKKSNKWRANIKLNNKEIHIGYFDKIEDAVEARNQKVSELNALGNQYI